MAQIDEVNNASVLANADWRLHALYNTVTFGIWRKQRTFRTAKFYLESIWLYSLIFAVFPAQYKGALTLEGIF